MLEVDEIQKTISQAAAAPIDRPGILLPKVVFVGGQNGCGKTMLTPIIGGLDRVEMQKYNYTMEHICSLRHLNRIDANVATSMVKMLLDMDIYNLQMSRETNFRPSDLSSVFKNPGVSRYLRRLFQEGDAGAVERIQNENPILHMVTHYLLLFGKTLVDAFGERALLLEVVRHPLYMIKQWFLYIDRYGTDLRDFTVCFRHKGHLLPFFTDGWEDKFIESNTMDRAIHTIDQLFVKANHVLNQMTPAQRAQVLFIPFESFVLNPSPYMGKITSALGTKVIERTRKEMKKQKVPRKMIADGISLPIYKQYGWQPPKSASEGSELDMRREFVAKHASAEGLKVMDRLCEQYEADYYNPRTGLAGKKA